jgi:hypothetical protein
MKQPQPAIVGLAQPPGSSTARKTATGFSDTWTGANIWQTRTFTAESQWGVRYTQSDPLLQNTGAHPFSYAHQNPLFFVDPYGLICSEWVSFGHHWTDEEWELDETGRWFPVPIVIPRGGPRTPIGLQLCCRFNIWERQYWGYDQLKRTCDCEDSAGADTYGVYTVREGCDCKRVEFKHANEEFQNYWSSFHVRPECKKVTPGFDCAILP